MARTLVDSALYPIATPNSSVTLLFRPQAMPSSAADPTVPASLPLMSLQITALLCAMTKSGVPPSASSTPAANASINGLPARDVRRAPRAGAEAHSGVTAH